jgi:hypothetical protein
VSPTGAGPMAQEQGSPSAACLKKTTHTINMDLITSRSRVKLVTQFISDYYLLKNDFFLQLSVAYLKMSLSKSICHIWQDDR